MTRVFLCLLALTGSLAQAGASITPVNAEEFRAELNTIEADVVLVNFWATWCRPCLEEIPVFMQLQEDYRDSGFRLIAVSLDDISGSNDQVLPFMQKWFPDFSSYISSEYDMDDIVSVIDNGWNEVLPTSYLIDRNGAIAERLQGTLSHEEFAAKIVALLDT